MKRKLSFVCECLIHSEHFITSYGVTSEQMNAYCSHNKSPRRKWTDEFNATSTSFLPFFSIPMSCQNQHAFRVYHSSIERYSHFILCHLLLQSEDQRGKKGGREEKEIYNFPCRCDPFVFYCCSLLCSSSEMMMMMMDFLFSLFPPP